jgi:hypothetical protein
VEVIPILRKMYQNERRSRSRVPLRWPVLLARPGDSGIVEAETENLSSQGFFCISPESFGIGEDLSCIVVLPAKGWGYDAQSVWLHCRVEVMRVEIQAPASGFGLGCRIEEFNLQVITGEIGAKPIAQNQRMDVELH